MSLPLRSTLSPSPAHSRLIRPPLLHPETGTTTVVMESSPQYVDMTLVPTGQMRDRSLWIHHIIPIPPAPLLARKWDYIIKRFHIWYEDSDGDDITVGSASELVAAIRELASENHFVRFHFKKSSLMDMDLLYNMMNELDRVKMRYRVLGSEAASGSISMDTTTRKIEQILPQQNFERRQLFLGQAKLLEEEIDPSIFEESVAMHGSDNKTVHIGRDINIGNNVIVGGNDINKVPEHNDMVPTPKELTPMPSPRFEPFANNDTPLVNLPCVPDRIPLLDITDSYATQSVTSDPPEYPPSESVFPTTSFPGAFPVDPTDSPAPQFQDIQSRIAAAFQRTIESISRIGHMTIAAAQNAGFPMLNANTFNEAHQSVDANAEFARATMEHNLEFARAQLQSSLESARANFEANLGLARAHLESGLESARSEINSSLTNARDSLANATQQVEQAIRNATATVQQSGVVSPSTVDRVIRDLRNAGERVERAVEDMTLRIQRQINEYAIPSTSREPESENFAHDEDEDLYGPQIRTSLPGSFPTERSKVDECTDRLVEMGFFSEGQRDAAGAVSIAADGDIANAIEIMEEGAN